MPNNPLISIIIPVYNVEDYLFKCLDSLEKQTVKNFEVIIIDDGSTDNTKHIYQKFEQKFDNYRIYVQENAGVSNARNKGIEISKGDYLYFMDSDDWVSENFIKIVLEELKKTVLDVIVFGHFKTSASGNILSRVNYHKKDILNLDKRKKDLFKILNTGVGLAVWDKIIKKTLVVNYNIQFLNMRNAEDFVFSVEIFKNAKNVLVLNENLYYYRIQMSGKRSDNLDVVTNHIIAMNAFLDFSKSLANSSSSVKIFIAKYSTLWFGIVIPINVVNFKKMSFKTKISLLNQIYKWKRFGELINLIKNSELKLKERLVWMVLRLNSPLALYYLGTTLSYLRSIKYSK